MKKNTASQVIGAQMVSATDGSAFTGSVTVYVTGDGGTQAAGSVGSGACAHEGNGLHTYAPAQAETNYDHIAFTFTGTGAIPTTVQVFTRAAVPDVNVTAISAGAVDSIHDEAIEGALTLRQAVRLLLSALAGKATGGGTASIAFRDLADTKNRVVMTVDAAGNRSAVSVDGS